jgi:4-nitrophenyl phosphatase
VCIPIDYTFVQMDPREPLLSALVKSRRAYLVDLDGVIYTGSRPIPGAGEFFEVLRQRKLPFQLITNNSTRTGTQVSDHLKGMGFMIEPEDILTSPEATAVFLGRDWPAGTPIMVIGEDGLVRAMVDAGFQLTNDASRAKVVVCGLDRRLTYERLVRATGAIRSGASFIATNPDLALPTEHGFLPGNGATLAYLEAATGVKPTVIGKPSPVMLEIAMARLGVHTRETVMIGDGLHTDILAGARASVATILVLTGVATIADVTHVANPPDVVTDSIDIVRRALIAHV